MALVPKTYDRNLPSPKFASTAAGKEEYNPEIVLSYNDHDELLKVEETWHGRKLTQTISGSNYDNYVINHSVTYSAWEETTVS
jgi:hypothetical protein